LLCAAILGCLLLPERGRHECSQSIHAVVVSGCFLGFRSRFGLGGTRLSKGGWKVLCKVTVLNRSTCLGLGSLEEQWLPVHRVFVSLTSMVDCLSNDEAAKRLTSTGRQTRKVGRLWWFAV
jgi:hypothetical protein